MQIVPAAVMAASVLIEADPPAFDIVSIKPNRSA
jgi:hypothetical protein